MARYNDFESVPSDKDSAMQEEIVVPIYITRITGEVKVIHKALQEQVSHPSQVFQMNKETLSHELRTPIANSIMLLNNLASD